MQKSDVRVHARHDLAVQIQNQAQHAMGGRMLGTEVDRQLRFFGGAVAGFGGNIFQRDFIIGGRGAHGFFPGLPEVASGAMTAFSSPGRMCGAPSQGLMKSKSRNSCTSWTGW